MPACKEERSFIKLNDRFSVLGQTGFFIKFCFILVHVIFVVGYIFRINGIDHFEELSLDCYRCLHFDSVL